MRFLADAGVSKTLVEWLRRQGHNAIHLREEGLQRISDSEIFAKAIVEQRVILTFDLDFGEILALSGSGQVSVILFRLHNTRRDHVIERMAAVLPDVQEALEKGAVIIIEESRHRIRTLPMEHRQ